MKKIIPRLLIAIIAVLIVITIRVIMHINTKYYKKVNPILVYDSVSMNTTDDLDAQKFFNQKVDLNNYEIAYVNEEKLEIAEDDLAVGVYEVFIKDKKTSVKYESLITIVDNVAPEVEWSEENVFYSTDYLDVSSFVKSCTDNVSEDCQFNIYDADGNQVEGFSRSVGEHEYTIEAMDENENKTVGEINYTVKNPYVLKDNTSSGIYYSSAGFDSDNPIAKHALSYVGMSGVNCEQFFYMSLFSTPGIKEKLEVYSDRQKYINEHRYEVPLAEAMPGDELRYANNGMGQPHVAIYIGNGLAVHGGFYGYLVAIYDAIMPNASLPRVYRYRLD